MKKPTNLRDALVAFVAEDAKQYSRLKYIGIDPRTRATARNAARNQVTGHNTAAEKIAAILKQFPADE